MYIITSQPHHFMYQIMCNSLICKRLYSLHINGDAQNDVQIYCVLLHVFLPIQTVEALEMNSVLSKEEDIFKQINANSKK